MNQYSAKLGIYSDKYTAEELNNILGITCDNCWVKGAPRSTRSDLIKFAKHAWFIKSELSDDNTLDNHIVNIYSKIKPVITKLDNIVGDCEIFINCTIEGDDNPVLNFQEDVINIIRIMHAGLDIDILIV